MKFLWVLSCGGSRSVLPASERVLSLPLLLPLSVTVHMLLHSTNHSHHSSCDCITLSQSLMSVESVEDSGIRVEYQV